MATLLERLRVLPMDLVMRDLAALRDEIATVPRTLNVFAAMRMDTRSARSRVTTDVPNWWLSA